MKAIDLTGKRFGRLTAIKLDHRDQIWLKNGNKDGHIYFWLCKCDCGNEIVIRKEYIANHNTKSCGCLAKENKPNMVHGMCRTRLYEIWKNMKRRCYVKSNSRYKNYGGRGVIVCSEWVNDFMAFYNWAMNNGYNDTLTIDRKNVDGNYEPNNCKWATWLEQSYNTTRTHYLTFNGKTQCISQWAKELSLSCSAIQHRLERNWSLEKTLTTPLRVRK